MDPSAPSFSGGQFHWLLLSTGSHADRAGLLALGCSGLPTKACDQAYGTCRYSSASAFSQPIWNYCAHGKGAQALAHFAESEPSVQADSTPHLHLKVVCESTHPTAWALSTSVIVLLCCNTSALAGATLSGTALVLLPPGLPSCFGQCLATWQARINMSPQDCTVLWVYHGFHCAFILCGVY